MTESWRMIFKVVNLALFFYLIHRYLWWRVKNYLDKKREKIENEREEAELELKGVLSELKETRELITRATLESTEILQSARDEGKRIREEVVHQAEEEAERILASAERRIERMRAEARSELRSFFIEFVLAEAEDRLKRRLRLRDEKRLFSAILTKIRGKKDALAAALPSSAGDKGIEDRIAAELSTFSQLIRRDERLRILLAHPEVLPEEKRKLIKEIAKKLSFCSSSIIFLNSLIKKRTANQPPFTSRLYTELIDEERGVVKSQVVSARKLTRKELDLLAATLEEGLGRKIKLEAKIDRSLIGGVKILVRDLLIDGTIKNQLVRLRDKLLTGDASEV
jgi:F-type H+-transporting ATPase subunit delta